METVLLIDADVLAYQCAAVNEHATEWEEGFWTWHCDENVVKDAIRDTIDRTVKALEADHHVLCLTDSDGNFRKEVLPSYKDNRAKTKKPLVLKAIKQWMLDELEAYWRPSLEGDDVMGILATWKRFHPGDRKIIVSIDKDMKTIPGLYVRDLDNGPVEITPEEAEWWHMAQTLTGDTTDGYKGCPGIGPKNAEKLLGEPGEFDAATLWRIVVGAYAKKGLPESEALIQARVARILQAGDYDFKRKRPILWTPPAA